MSTAKAIQSWMFEFSYGAKDEGEEEGSRRYKLPNQIDVSKAADGKPVKIYSVYDTRDYIDHHFRRVKEGKFKDLKNLLATKGETKYHNGGIKGHDNRYPATAIDVEVVNVCYDFVSRLSLL